MIWPALAAGKLSKGLDYTATSPGSAKKESASFTAMLEIKFRLETALVVQLLRYASNKSGYIKCHFPISCASMKEFMLTIHSKS